MTEEQLDIIISAIAEAVREDMENINRKVDVLSSRLDSVDSLFQQSREDLGNSISTLEDTVRSISQSINGLAPALTVDEVYEAVNGNVLKSLNASLEASVVDLEGRHKMLISDHIARGIDVAVKAAVNGLEIPAGKDGRDGENGKDGRDAIGIKGVDVGSDAVTIMLDDERSFQIKNGENGKDGRDGIDGLNGKDGQNGTDGKDGRDGVDGKDGVNGENGKDGKDGVDGQNGADGRDGIDGLKGLDGLNGKDGSDGVSLADATIDREGSLILINSKGVQKNLGLVVGHDAVGRAGVDGRDGKDGLDGLGFDDIQAEFDGERTVALKFVRGENAKEFTFKIPALIYRGFYRKDAAYEIGDTVTYGGSTWHANKATTAAPSEASDDWQLAVKRGLTGASVKGERGEKGLDGINGKDLTQVGPNGEKW